MVYTKPNNGKPFAEIPINGKGPGTFNGVPGTWSGGTFTPKPPPPSIRGIAGVVIVGGLVGVGLGTKIYEGAGRPNTRIHKVIAWLTDPFRPLFPPPKPKNSNRGGGYVQAPQEAVEKRPGQVPGVVYSLFVYRLYSWATASYQGAGPGPISVTPFFPNTNAKGFRVKWGNGVENTLGPWVIGRVPDDEVFEKLIRGDGTSEQDDIAGDPNGRPSDPGVPSPGGTNQPPPGATPKPPPGNQQKPEETPKPTPKPPPPGIGTEPPPGTRKPTPQPQPQPQPIPDPPPVPDPTPRPPEKSPDPTPRPGGDPLPPPTTTPTPIPSPPPRPQQPPQPTPYPTPDPTPLPPPTTVIDPPPIKKDPIETQKPKPQLKDPFDTSKPPWLDSPINPFDGKSPWIEPPTNKKPPVIQTQEPPKINFLETLIEFGIIAGTIDPRTGKPIQTQPQGKEEPKAPPPVNTPGGSGSTCMYPGYHSQVMGGHSSTQGQVGGLNTLLTGTTNVQIAQANTGIEAIKTSIGSPIAGGAQTLFEGFNNLKTQVGNFAQSMHFDKALNMLNFVLNLHNAFMLSRNVVFTVGELMNTVINGLGGLWKDETLSNFDINQVIGSWFNDRLNDALGKEQNAELQKNLAKYNRILTAATNMLNAVEGMLYSIISMTSLIGEYQGKVGNALKRSGAVMENSYEWMQEKWNMMTGRRFKSIDNYINGVNTIEEVSDNLTGIAGEAFSVPQQMAEIQEAKNDLLTNIQDKPKENSPVATKVKETEDTARTNSQGAVIANQDLIKPE